MGNISHSKYWTVLLCPVSHTFIITNMLFGLIKVNLAKINNNTSYRPGWVQCKLFCTSVTWNGTKTKKKTVAALLFTPSIGKTIRKHFIVQITHIQIICLCFSFGQQTALSVDRQLHAFEYFTDLLLPAINCFQKSSFFSFLLYNLRNCNTAQRNKLKKCPWNTLGFVRVPNTF